MIALKKTVLWSSSFDNFAYYNRKSADFIISSQNLDFPLLHFVHARVKQFYFSKIKIKNSLRLCSEISESDISGYKS